MNTNQLKKFAQEARRKLLEQVGAKLNFVLTTDSAELREKTEQLKELRLELSRTNKEQLIEKVAYTWFNRLMALRFMDVNDYQTLGIRIITPKDGYTIPEILDEAKRGNIPDELKVNRQKIYDLLDNKIPSKNPQNEAFKELLIAVCNHLNTTFPFLFEKINDYTELLLPDDLTSDFSILKDVRVGMLIEDCKNVEIIGWLYQFYISEKKDEVFASKSKVKKEDIPAATQLFTPRWIVEYMVQNTLGKLWLQNRPKSKLRKFMPYFIESAYTGVDDYLKIQSPEEIKLVDPACGSGHILVYAFDLFTKIYEEEGYSTSEIPQLVIENNLYGFEIDDRAAQLSGLAIMMKAREIHRRILHKPIKPNILCYKDLQINNVEIKEVLASTGINTSDELMHDLQLIHQATNLGSLIIPQASKEEIISAYQVLTQSAVYTDIFKKSITDAIINALSQLVILNQKFHCVFTNPPYMGGGNMNIELSAYVKSNYPDSKADLMSCFMEAGLNMLHPNGFLGMINLPSWLFLSSFEKIREKLIVEKHIDSLLHMGRGIFGIDWGSTAFVIQNRRVNVPAKYFKLHKRNFQHLYSEDIRQIFLKAKNDETIRINFDKYREGIGIASVDDLIDYNGMQIAYTVDQNEFAKIPGCTIGFWLDRTTIKSFETLKSASNYGNAKPGIQTGFNDRFLRYWYEVICIKINRKWFFYRKGGTNRKWFGNVFLLLNWENDGKEIKNFKSIDGKLLSRPQNLDYQQKECITWSLTSSNGFSMRYAPKGQFFDVNGMSFFPFKNEHIKILLSLFNSKCFFHFLKILNPTLAFQAGDILKVPICEFSNDTNLNSDINIDISKQDWDTRETAFEFKNHEFLRLKGQDIEESYALYQQYWKIKFTELHKNEENLNHKFISVYELQNELNPDVPLEDITILQEELDRKKLVQLNKRLIRDTNHWTVQNYKEIDLPFITSEVIAQFISYSVGCMFGRYSLEKEGLILANQGETLQDFLSIIGKSVNECLFLPDRDNIIPVMDNEWFDDDIVERFGQFLKSTFGNKNFGKNLSFIEEQIGMDIRKYFMKEFWSDHIKRYDKRPIYWMFSSPKGSFNVLVYMHRYTPDTVSNILNKYLKEFIGKLNTRKEHLEHVQVTGSASDRTKAIKEIDNIEKMLIELHEYERDVLYPLATERIEIDLDDGVLVNYNKFEKSVKEVNGLNDPATKKKVKQFDWIDTSQIR